LLTWQLLTYSEQRKQQKAWKAQKLTKEEEAKAKQATEAAEGTKGFFITVDLCLLTGGRVGPNISREVP